MFFSRSLRISLRYFRLELGLGDSVELKTVNLAEGENFRPEFLAKVGFYRYH